MDAMNGLFSHAKAFQLELSLELSLVFHTLAGDFWITALAA